MPTGQPQVSVVIPAYNASATVERAIGSVLAQTLPVAEIVVVDDGSVDCTAELAQQMSPDVRVVRQATQGPAGARNAGVAAAAGEWIAFLDADDLWHPDKLEIQLGVLAEHPDAAIVAADWSLRLDAPSPSRVRVKQLTTRDLLVFNRLQTSTVLMRRALALALHGFDSQLDGAEDWDLWIRASRAGKVVKVNRPLVQYALRPDSYSRADTGRVYRAATVLLGRELDDQAPGGRSLHAWHYLQFAAGFRHASQPEQARRCVEEMRGLGLLGSVPTAVVRYLPGHLARRLARTVLPRFAMAERRVGAGSGGPLVTTRHP